MYLFSEIRQSILIECHKNCFAVEKIQFIICLKLTFLEITHWKIWVSWGVIFEGLGVQMTQRCPADYDYSKWEVPMGMGLSQNLSSLSIGQAVSWNPFRTGKVFMKNFYFWPFVGNNQIFSF